MFPFVSTLLVGLSRGKVAPWISVSLAATYFFIVLVGLPPGQLRFSLPWFEGLNYSLFLDSYSYFLILLSAFLTWVALAFSVKSVQEKQVAYHALFHGLQATVVASLLCDDLLFFYIFWEAMLIPMYFIIGIWGGTRRKYAALKFFLYTLAGSLVMLVGLVSLYVLYYQQTQEWNFSFQILRDYFLTKPLDLSVQRWIFLSMVLSFVIKVPLFPFHTWLPDAHVEAPTAGSVVLAGILLKLGTYGLMRFAIPLFPEAARDLAPYLVALSVVGIVVGALIAWRQTDIKKLIAYSSVSHLGFVTLGIFMMNETAWNGAYFQMINHGISTGALFLLVGFIYDQAHTRDIHAFGGLAKSLPIFSTIFIIISLSSMALPGTNGFIGEFLILLGSFQSTVAPWIFVVIASSGVILGAIYMLHLIQKVCFGKERANFKLNDFVWKDLFLYGPFVVLVFVLGIFPELLLSSIRESTTQIFGFIEKGWGG